MEAIAKGLADVGDSLVGRKKVGGGRTVKQKYVECVWTIVGPIKRCEALPRTLLKNGKRSKEAWQQSQARQREAGNQITTNSDASILSEGLVFPIDSAQRDGRMFDDKSDGDICVSGGDRNQVGQEYGVGQSSASVSAGEVAFSSAVVGDINLLERDVKDIHTEIQKLRKGGICSEQHTSTGTCVCM